MSGQKNAERIEIDSLGEVAVPKEALWGAQTQRCLKNFYASGITFPPIFLEALLLIKKGCAEANGELGEIPDNIASAISQAAQRILKEKQWHYFPLDIIQTGSGTQINMNANEVLGNIASELLGGIRGSKSPVHPNDHVNKGQSSNDIIPAAMHLSISLSYNRHLLPALRMCKDALLSKAKEFTNVIKVGRTHLQDAVPISLGQEFETFAYQLTAVEKSLSNCLPTIYTLPIGGTAVGTGLNAHPKLGETVCNKLKQELNLPISLSQHPFSQIANHDDLVTFSGALRTNAIALIKIANDIRLLASGPRCGLGEIMLPANEPGSSIMPGKVNPTQAEAVVQACLKVIGNDTTISAAGYFGGQLDLHSAKPIIIQGILESMQMLSNVMTAFTEKCLLGITPNLTRIQELLNQSLMLATTLTPKFGYDKATQVAKYAYEHNLSVSEAVIKMNLLNEDELSRVFDLRSMVFKDM